MIEIDHPPYSASENSVATFAAMLWADAQADEAEHTVATPIIGDTPIEVIVVADDAAANRDDQRIAAVSSLGAVAADRVISVVPTPRRGRTGQQPASEAGRSDGATSAPLRRSRSRRPRRTHEEAAIPTLAQLVGPLPVKHAVDSDASTADDAESQAFVGLFEDDEFGGHTRTYPGGADRERRDASTLIDEGALPKWMREGQAEDGGATAKPPALTERDEAAAEEEPITERREAVAPAPVIAAHDDERSEPIGLSAASLIELSPSQSLQGLHMPEVAAQVHRSATTSKEKERAALQEDNERVLLNLVGQLEDRWYELNAPDSQVLPEDRRDELIATAMKITGLRYGEMRAIRRFEGWGILRHDVAAMLHTGERYAEADKLMRNQLGVSLNEFMALGIKSMQGDFYNGQRYAAGLSIRDAIFGYLKVYGFELPIRTGFDDAYVKALGRLNIQSAPPVEQRGHRVVSGLDLTQIRSDLADRATHAIARVGGWLGNIRPGDWFANAINSGAGVYEAQAHASAFQQPSASGVPARQQAQAPGTSDSARRTPLVQPRPAPGSNPSGVRPAMASSPSRPEARVPRVLTAEELATFTTDQFYEAGHKPKDLPMEVQERLARIAAQTRAEDSFLVDGQATGKQESAPKPNYL